MTNDLRKIDQLVFQRAKVFLSDGTTRIGKGDCICDASEGDGQDIDGILFFSDDGSSDIWTEDEILKIELLEE